MSEIPMVEQEVIGRIQPRIERKIQPDGNAFVKSADATWLSRFKNLVHGKTRQILELSLEKIKEPAKKGVTKVALTGAALSYLISSGCGNVEKQTPPPPTLPAAVSELPTGIPSEVEFQRLTTPTAESPLISTPIPESPHPPTPTLEPTPTSTPFPTEISTPKVEVQQPKVISMGGTVEPDPTSPAGEKIKLLFPEGIVNGESPLIPKGDTLSLYLKLNSVKGIGIRECSLSISDLLGIKNYKSSVTMNPTNASATADIASTIRSFQRIAKFSVSDDQEIIKQITFTCRSSNEGVVVNLSLPNESFTYTDKDGSHLVNPAERYVSGKVGLGINRGNIAIGRFALTVEDIKIENGKGKLVATADRFDITSPTRTPVPTRPPETTQVPVKPPIPTIQATEIPTPEPKEEENKWTGREWAPNETVPIQEWWNDMVLKGHISIDAIAQQYTGERIDNFLKGANLVPNPVQYYKQGHSFINNCNLELDKLVMQGQGHIKITSDAYAQIPGGVECQIFTKDK